MGEKVMIGVLVLHPLLLWVPVRMTQRIIQLLVALKGDVFTGMLLSRQHSAFSFRIAEQVLQPGLQGTCVSSWERIKAQQVWPQSQQRWGFSTDACSGLFKSKGGKWLRLKKIKARSYNLYYRMKNKRQVQLRDYKNSLEKQLNCALWYVMSTRNILE